MAVRAQYPPNVLLLNRAEGEMNGMEINMEFPHNPVRGQSDVFFSNGGLRFALSGFFLLRLFCEGENGAGNVNRRKRGREMATIAATPQQYSVFSLQSPSTLDLAQRQPRTPSFVSTGLRLAIDEQNHTQIKREHPDSLMSDFYSEDLAAQINKENNEIDQFLIEQGEQLRQALVETQQRHCRALLESAGRRLQEKEAEVERAARCNTELEERLARFQSESKAWQAKALTEQAVAVSLHAQLQKAAVAAAAAAAAPEVNRRSESPAEDQESAYLDPYRSDTLERPCRACHRRPATVVLLPCRQLCLCRECDFAAAASGDGCPSCGCFRTGSLQVSFS